MRRMLFAVVLVSTIALFSIAANAAQSTGGIEIENRTDIWCKEGLSISRVEYLSYSADDLNYANWQTMCGSTLIIGETCYKGGLAAGNYIVRTLWGGETIEVFTDVNVSAGSTTRISAERIYVEDSITIINESSYDILEIMAQEGNYVSDPVSLAHKPIIKGEISPGSWQTINLNGDFPAHNILIRDEVDGHWFYEVPIGGLIIWTGSGGEVFDKSIYFDFLGNPPGGIYVELYQGDFREIFWEPLNNGVYRGSLPNEENYDFWNVYTLDSYCGGTTYGAAFCSVDLTGNSPSSPFVIDPCNFSSACNGYSSGDLP
jgi:hypothetical protein